MVYTQQVDGAYDATIGSRNAHNGMPHRIPLTDARAVFAHMWVSVTRNYLIRKGVVLYSGFDSQHPLNGGVKSFNPSELWVDLSEVERVVSSIATPSIRGAMLSRLELLMAAERKI